MEYGNYAFKTGTFHSSVPVTVFSSGKHVQLQSSLVFETKGKRIISLLHSQLHYRILTCFGWTKTAFLSL